MRASNTGTSWAWIWPLLGSPSSSVTRSTQRAGSAPGAVGVVLAATAGAAKRRLLSCATGADALAAGVDEGEHPDHGTARTGRRVPLQPGPTVAAHVVALDADPARLGHLAARADDLFPQAVLVSAGEPAESLWGSARALGPADRGADRAQRTDLSPGVGPRLGLAGGLDNRGDQVVGCAGQDVAERDQDVGVEALGRLGHQAVDVFAARGGCRARRGGERARWWRRWPGRPSPGAGSTAW